jgi:SPP1 gp7 family putative phage head morphogenesis protein
MKRRRRKLNLLRPVRPNAGLEASYRREILKMVDGMQAETMRLIKRAYQMNPPEMAADAETPADYLQLAMNEIAKRWQAQFDVGAPMLAEYFATAVRFRTDSALKAALRKGGFSVEFRLTPAVKDILGATIEANVGLIRSIPAQYLTQVQGMVMRSVQTGRDAGQLYADIRSQFNVTRRRAALISRDQSNKATSAIREARNKEAGITESVWMHSSGGKKPRPKHVKANGTVYKTGVGLPIGDKGEFVLPGESINCRCVSRAVIPGF